MKDVTNEIFISVHMVKAKNLIEEIQDQVWHLWSLLPFIKEPRYQSLGRSDLHNHSAPSVPGIHLRTPIHQHMEERPFLYSNQ